MSDEGKFLFGKPGHPMPSTLCGRFQLTGFSLSSLGILLEVKHPDDRRSVARGIVPSWDVKTKVLKLHLSDWAFSNDSFMDFQEEGLEFIDATDIEIDSSIWNHGISNVVVLVVSLHCTSK